MAKLGSDWLWIGLGIGSILIVNNINKNGILSPVFGYDNNNTSNPQPYSNTNQLFMPKNQTLANVNPIYSWYMSVFK
jgi:hypothetical protein